MQKYGCEGFKINHFIYHYYSTVLINKAYSNMIGHFSDWIRFVFDPTKVIGRRALKKLYHFTILYFLNTNAYIVNVVALDTVRENNDANVQSSSLIY